MAPVHSKLVLVGVEGLIGVGKTTGIREVCKRFGFHAVFEPVETNPWIKLFYGDPTTYAEVTQAWMFKHRVHDFVHALRSGPDNTTLFFFDRHWPHDGAFVVANTEAGNIGDVFYAAYFALVDMLVNGGLPLPHLALFFNVTPEECLRRVLARGRKMEEGIPVEYQQKLGRGYDVVRKATADQGTVWIDVDWEQPK